MLIVYLSILFLAFGTLLGWHLYVRANAGLAYAAPFTPVRHARLLLVPLAAVLIVSVAWVVFLTSGGLLALG